MREILFKAKHIMFDKWYEGYYVKMERLHYICVLDEGFENGYRLVEINQETLCQYTGLTDKNGDKIWENDIVEIPREDDYFRIEWQDDTASFVMNNDSFTVTFDNYWSYETEVIGNVFDSTEFGADMRGEKND